MKKQLIISLLSLLFSIESYAIIAFHKTIADTCGQIVLKNGDVIQANILQISATEIKYKRCGKPNDIEIGISKTEVIVAKDGEGNILYRNQGTSENVNNTRTTPKEDLKTHPLAITSLATGILSLLMTPAVAILLGAGAIICGFFARKRIKELPNHYKGRKMAAWGIGLGIVAVVFGLALVLGAGAY